MWIKYIIPEDGDDQAHPNTFKINTNSNITLIIIKQAFPLKGVYQYRFLKKISPSLTVCIKNGQDVKVNKTVGNSTSIKNEEKVKNTLLQFDDFDEVPSFVSATTNINTSASVPKASIIQQSNSSNADLLGIDTNDLNVNPTPNKQNSSIDLFGLDTLQPATTSNPIMNNTSTSKSSNYQANNPMMQSRGFDPFNDLVNNNNQYNRNNQQSNRKY
eukprot:gene20108-26108_t